MLTSIFRPHELAWLISHVCIQLFGDIERAELEQILGIAAVESGLIHRRQIGGGPARGLWQMEPGSAKSLFDNSLVHNTIRHRKLMRLWLNLDIPHDWSPSLEDLAWHLEHNDRFACAMARLYLTQFPEPLPKTLEDQAATWKAQYNTRRGKGTVKGYMAAWRDCKCDKLVSDFLKATEGLR